MFKSRRLVSFVFVRELDKVELIRPFQIDISVCKGALLEDLLQKCSPASNRYFWQRRFQKDSLDDNDVLRKIGILGVTASDICQMGSRSRQSIDDRSFSGPFRLNTRGQRSDNGIESATKLLDIGFLIQEGQKSESNLSVAKRSETKNENEVPELVFFKRTKLKIVRKDEHLHPHV
ncbi:unnamed protein product [Hymenolepis diminuta]|uniref:Ubiquitin-like domain-containing protein n=1 Tax=Hymenolepis diminuta TaxID=6216 RepID=A0A0R3SM27_HYMDI|nr:unnamed protein product [Hymenolepis diminuta]